MMERAAYSGLDRLLHRVAFDEVFHGIALQRALAELEDGLVARKIEAVAPSAPPVFVTALPRAGTTLVLNLLARVPGFASHTYRDMPFLLAPLLWGRLSRPFRKSASEAERAHGDGVMVGYDSPEAFEEVLWLAFWRDKYHADRIEPWTADDRDPEFESFFNRHIAKLLAARAAERDGPPPNRYLSKNNANIARLGLLPELFPGCRIVVPLREPLSHARSLLRQHKRFCAIHADDDFARRYMGWLGHFEFGAELRPIAFPGGPHEAPFGGPEALDFWLGYWIAAHEAILAAGNQVMLFDYAALCDEPADSLEALAGALELETGGVLVGQAAQVRATPTAHDDDGAGAPSLRRRAAELYEAALARCINRNGG